MPTDIIAYGGWLAVLVIAAHITIRLRAAYADPIMLPIVSALNGIGLAMIYRIDLAEPGKTPAAPHPAGLDDASACCSSSPCWLVLRDHRRLQAFTYTAGLASIVLLLLPLVPGHRPRDPRRPDLDPPRGR